MRTKKLKKFMITLTAAFFLVCCTGAAAWSLEQVDINTATCEQLTRLKGIGPKTATKIIEYRETNGTFDSPEEITKVPGIGPKVLENNKDLITVTQ
ncbi:MAG TPA: helix-hairpin-helix domain-containing protein [Desulfobacteraceae bacterium]|jgi:competence protein ComEA|nr:helix-hairpin-helix domain-containing protein [Desulfobacteraceae bacterium]